MKYFKLLSFFILTHISLMSFSADAPIYSKPGKGAIAGADPVAYFSLEPGDKAVIGKDAFSYTWKSAQWKFASEENRQKFIDNPDKYAPQYGGYCAFAVANGITQSIHPNRWKVVNDKLYLNYNRIAFFRWKTDMEEKIVEADNNWPEVLKACEKDKACKFKN